MISAFVLKCPECGAPQPGAVANCKYCKVPLMWAPSGSLSRDDGHDFEVEDDPDTELMSFSDQVAAASTHTFSFITQKIVKPTHLWLSRACAPDLEVTKLTIGLTHFLNASLTNMAGELFCRGRGFPIANAETCYPGMQIQVYLKNVTVFPLSVRGSIRVRAVPEREYPQPDGYRPQIVGDHLLPRNRYPGTYNLGTRKPR